MLDPWRERASKVAVDVLYVGFGNISRIFPEFFNSIIAKAD